MNQKMAPTLLAFRMSVLEFTYHKGQEVTPYQLHFVFPQTPADHGVSPADLFESAAQSLLWVCGNTLCLTPEGQGLLTSLQPVFERVLEKMGGDINFQTITGFDAVALKKTKASLAFVAERPDVFCGHRTLERRHQNESMRIGDAAAEVASRLLNEQEIQRLRVKVKAPSLEGHVIGLRHPPRRVEASGHVYH